MVVIGKCHHLYVVFRLVIKNNYLLLFCWCLEAFRNLLMTSAPIESSTLETEVDSNTEKKYTSKGCPNLCCRRTELPVFTEYKGQRKIL